MKTVKTLFIVLMFMLSAGFTGSVMANADTEAQARFYVPVDSGCDGD
jgi:hypothetical protein